MQGRVLDEAAAHDYGYGGTSVNGLCNHADRAHQRGSIALPESGGAGGGQCDQRIRSAWGGGYQVDDGSGKIYVLSTGSGVPSKGSRVLVSGTVINGATVMGKSYGTAIREQKHKVE